MLLTSHKCLELIVLNDMRQCLPALHSYCFVGIFLFRAFFRENCIQLHAKTQKHKNGGKGNSAETIKLVAENKN